MRLFVTFRCVLLFQSRFRKSSSPSLAPRRAAGSPQVLPESAQGGCWGGAVSLTAFQMWCMAICLSTLQQGVSCQRRVGAPSTFIAASEVAVDFNRRRSCDPNRHKMHNNYTSFSSSSKYNFHRCKLLARRLSPAAQLHSPTANQDHGLVFAARPAKQGHEDHHSHSADTPQGGCVEGLGCQWPSALPGCVMKTLKA